MDLFRSKKKKDMSEHSHASEPMSGTASGEASSPASTHSLNSRQGTLSHHSRTTLDQGIDALVDSDEEAAEIFDDDEEDMVVQSASGSIVDGAASLTSPRNFKDVMDELRLAVPTIIQHEVADASRNSFTDHDHNDQNSVGTESDDDNKSGGSDSAEDYTDDEDEGADGYKPGGYHPVKVGESYNQR